MECYFKNGFEVLREEIIKNGVERHILNINNDLIYVRGLSCEIDGYEYLFCKYIHPATKNKIKKADNGIFIAENYLLDKEIKSIGNRYQYIIKIENKNHFKTNKPLVLHIKNEWKDCFDERYVNHSGYYSCGRIFGLSFNSNGAIGFLPDKYIPMLKGEKYKQETYGGRWNKLLGYTEFTIIEGEDWVREFIIEKTIK